MPMFYTSLRVSLLSLAMLWLTACFGPETPQDVAEAFWNKVANDDARGAVRYSTLEEARNFDAFGEQWQGYDLEWGRLVIDGEEASIDTRFIPDKTNNGREQFYVTYLIREKDRWLVDYDRTAAGIRGGVFGDLFLRLNRFSREVSRQFDQSAAQTSSDVEVMLEQLEAQQEELSHRASEALEEYSEALDDALHEMQRSIERALRENDRELSAPDRKLLQATVTDLEDSRKHLDPDSLLSVAHSSHAITSAQQSLAQTNSDPLVRYQRQWQEMVERFSRDMQGLIKELSAPR